MKTRLRAVAIDWLVENCIVGGLNVQFSNGQAKNRTLLLGLHNLIAQRQALFDLGDQGDQIVDWTKNGFYET